MLTFKQFSFWKYKFSSRIAKRSTYGLVVASFSVFFFLWKKKRKKKENDNSDDHSSVKNSKRREKTEGTKRYNVSVCVCSLFTDGSMVLRR